MFHPFFVIYPISNSLNLYFFTYWSASCSLEWDSVCNVFCFARLMSAGEDITRCATWNCTSVRKPRSRGYVTVLVNLKSSNNISRNWYLIIIIGCRVLIRTFTASHRKFRNHDKTLGRTLWTSDQPVAKASTCTGQHNTKTNMYASSGIGTHDPSNAEAKTWDLDRSANWTDIGIWFVY
jgi:hypothetical protein